MEKLKPMSFSKWKKFMKDTFRMDDETGMNITDDDMDHAVKKINDPHFKELIEFLEKFEVELDWYHENMMLRGPQVVFIDPIG